METCGLIFIGREKYEEGLKKREREREGEKKVKEGKKKGKIREKEFEYIVSTGTLLSNAARDILLYSKPVV